MKLNRRMIRNLLSRIINELALKEAIPGPSGGMDRKQLDRATALIRAQQQEPAVKRELPKGVLASDVESDRLLETVQEIYNALADLGWDHKAQ